MAMKISGVNKTKREITRRINDIAGKVTKKSMLEGLILGANYATLLTPVDTANLINSQFIDGPVKTANGWKGSVKYTANYAAYVHDGGPKDWQKIGAEDLFLEKGFEDNLNEIMTAVKNGQKRL
jgi:hypothetical protein